MALSMFLSLYPSACLLLYLSVHRSIRLSLYRSIPLSLYLFIALSVYFSAHLCVCVYLSVSVCPLVYINIVFVGCVLIRDETKMGRFRFAHSGTLDALYTRIGLFEDEQPLRANNFAHHRSRRRWATSRSTPMAANIVFVKYRCRHPPLIRVKTLVNENVNRPVTIPGCPPSALCPLDTLTALWRPIADNCDIERICDQPSTTTTTTNNDAMKTASTPTDA